MGAAKLSFPVRDLGYLDMAGRYISMKAAPNRMMAVVKIKNHRLTRLELTAYGGDFWNGMRNIDRLSKIDFRFL
jgi:hypothetical protein